MHRQIVIALSWALVSLTQGIVVHAAESYRVHRVVDGDTIILRSDSSPSDITIRLVGIDAPETSKAKREPGQPYSQAATKHLAALILNKAVTIREYGRDRFCEKFAV